MIGSETLEVGAEDSRFQLSIVVQTRAPGKRLLEGVQGGLNAWREVQNEERVTSRDQARVEISRDGVRVEVHSIRDLRGENQVIVQRFEKGRHCREASGLRHRDLRANLHRVSAYDQHRAVETQRPTPCLLVASKED